MAFKVTQLKGYGLHAWRTMLIYLLLECGWPESAGLEYQKHWVWIRKPFALELK